MSSPICPSSFGFPFPSRSSSLDFLAASSLPARWKLEVAVGDGCRAEKEEDGVDGRVIGGDSEVMETADESNVDWREGISDRDARFAEPWAPSFLNLQARQTDSRAKQDDKGPTD
jgi:hypothetical protein